MHLQKLYLDNKLSDVYKGGFNYHVRTLGECLLKCERMRTEVRRGRGPGWGYVNANVRISILLTEPLFNKLPRIITKFFFSFIKIPVLLKVSVLKNIYFATNFQPIINVTKNSILLYVMRVVDTPLVKFCFYFHYVYFCFSK